MPSRQSDVTDLLQKGLALHEHGRLTEAESMYRECLVIAPNNFDAHHLLGVAAFQRGDIQHSIELLTTALGLDPTQSSAHTNLGNAYHALGNLEEAIASYNQAILLAPRDIAVHLNRGNALQDAGDLLNALASYDRAIEIDPCSAEAHNNRGNVLVDLSRTEEALESFSQALAFRPDYVDALVNKGSTLRAVGNFDSALTCLERALTVAPANPFALNNRGNVLRDLGRFPDAIRSYNDALTIAPDLADAYLNMSYAYLVCGDLRRGFELYEWRRKVPTLSRFMRQFEQPPLSDLQSLAGKTVLVHSEQGFGDTIQFCRYTTALRSRGANVILEVQHSLKLLMQELEGPSVVIAEGDPLPQFDYYVPLLSLPFLFGTTIDSIPSPGKYLKSSDEKRTTWLSRLGSDATPRVGLAWSCSPPIMHGPDRSIPLTELLPSLPRGPRYVCLQKEIRESDKEALGSRLDIQVVHEDLGDFADTAALIDSVDIVISVDTAVAHLAGALLRPVLVMLPFNGEWRWLRGRNDSPWYPSAIVSRQTKPGEWGSVLADVFQRILPLTGSGVG